MQWQTTMSNVCPQCLSLHSSHTYMLQGVNHASVNLPFKLCVNSLEFILFYVPLFPRRVPSPSITLYTLFQVFMTLFVTWSVSPDLETLNTNVAAEADNMHHAPTLQLTGGAAKASVGGSVNKETPSAPSCPEFTACVSIWL